MRYRVCAVLFWAGFQGAFLELGRVALAKLLDVLMEYDFPRRDPLDQAALKFTDEAPDNERKRHWRVQIVIICSY
jgi:hypothetical protein